MWRPCSFQNRACVRQDKHFVNESVLLEAQLMEFSLSGRVSYVSCKFHEFFVGSAIVREGFRNLAARDLLTLVIKFKQIIEAITFLSRTTVIPSLIDVYEIWLFNNLTLD
jgi:hypothetical protein